MSEFLDAYYPNQYMGESIERDDAFEGCGEYDDLRPENNLDAFEEFGDYDYRLTGI